MDLPPDYDKQVLVYNIINFLQDELVHGNLNDEKKESIEVATQCLETAFELDSQVKEKMEKDKVNLLDFICIPPRTPDEPPISDEDRNKAEEHKNKGNAFMKNSEHAAAVEEYTKAINLNPNNAVYFCNRAAAHSRLEKHYEAINDCNEAIKLDPTYGKAYGRLGIAYSNLNKFDLARKALLTAKKYDPSNAMYETNLKLAEEKLFSTMGNDNERFYEKKNAAPPEHRPMDISQFINNPNIINMATQMLSDPNFCNIMSGLMSMGQAGDPNMDALFQAGQTLASRMQSADPGFVEGLRRTLNGQGTSGQSDPSAENPASANPSSDNPPESGKSTENPDKNDK